MNEKSPKWEKYLYSSSAFTDIVGVKQTEYYELARNWRIAWDLAGGRSIALINLGPDAIFKRDDEHKIQQFSKCLSQNNTHKFNDVTWTRFFEGVSDHPQWFDNYLKERGFNA